MAKVKYLSVKSPKAAELENFGNFHKSGSIKFMKKKFYGNDALLVRCGQWIYNVSSKPEIYHNWAK